MNRWSWGLALLALLLVVACQGESPTAPTGNPGTGTPPPTGAALTVTVSNPKPLVSSTSVITATVTQNGTPVTNGTAVEFETDLGVFTDTSATKTIRTTTNGVATATLSSTTPGTATVTVRVNNIAKTATVAFQEVPSEPPPVDTSVSITSIDPTFGAPAGGQIVRIIGKNFREPLRVLFGTQEARVVSFTPTEIKVMTPPINLGPTAQAQEVDVTVIDEAGTTNEQRAVSPQKFRYQLEILTPNIFTVSPSSGPNEGNTRIVIFGEGFQAPVKVYFGTGGGPGPLNEQVDVDVVSVSYNQIIAITPPALGLASELRDQQVTIRVQNVASNTDGVLARAFRYGPLMQITSISPGQGPFTGGTKVTITGWGFDDPVAVSIGGVAAQVIRVSGTEIVAMTGAVPVTGCAATSGSGTKTTVTNIEDGATAEGPDFLYQVPQPTVLSVTPSSALPGSVVQVAVQNAFGAARIDIGGTNSVVQSFTTSGTVTTYSVVVPTTFTFDTTACAAGGTRAVPTITDVVYTSVTSGCTNTFANGLTVTPPTTGSVFLSPTSFAPFTAQYTPATAGPPATPATMTPSAPQTVTLVNAGGGPLAIQSVTLGAGCATFAITTPAAPQTLNPCDSADITAFYNPPVAGGAGQSATCSVTILTDAGAKTLTLVGSTN